MNCTFRFFEPGTHILPTSFISEYAGAVSNVANLEEQLAQVKDEFRSSREVIQEQAGTIQSLSSEGSSLKVVRKIGNMLTNSMILIDL